MVMKETFRLRFPCFTPDFSNTAYYNQSKQELKYAVRAPVASP
jgi:hypothetical protein